MKALAASEGSRHSPQGCCLQLPKPEVAGLGLKLLNFSKQQFSTKAAPSDSSWDLCKVSEGLAKALGVVPDLSLFLSQASWGPNPCCVCRALVGRPELPFPMEGRSPRLALASSSLRCRELVLRPSVRAALRLLPTVTREGHFHTASQASCKMHTSALTKGSPQGVGRGTQLLSWSCASGLLQPRPQMSESGLCRVPDAEESLSEVGGPHQGRATLASWSRVPAWG